MGKIAVSPTSICGNLSNQDITNHLPAVNNLVSNIKTRGEYNYLE